MADITNGGDMQDAMKKQLADLRREMNKINKMLAERADSVAEDAADWYDAASERASQAGRQLRAGARSVSETVQQNPGTVSTALVLGGIAGFMIGMLIGQGSGTNDRRWY